MEDASVDATVPLDSTKAITQFSIAGVMANITGDSIELTVPHDTRLRNITPDLEFAGAALAPRALDPQDFTKDVTYSVMAQDGSTRVYTVKVTVAPNNNRAITHFRVFGIESKIEGDRIDLALPAGSDLTQLVPAITLSGGTVEPPSDVAQDFSHPVEYTVTGADGATQRYTVYVTLQLGSANDIMTFDVPGAVTTFRGDDIELSVPYGTSSCRWAPTIVHAGATIAPASGTSEDFATPVTYTVTAGDGSQRTYTARCNVAQTSARGISRFEVLGLPASIGADAIILTVPNATNLGALTPTITHHGVRISPASGVPQSFYAPVPYTVLEADGSQHTYSVTVMPADRSDNQLVELEVAGRYAAISGDEARLTLPLGTDMHALAPTLLHRGARVIPVSGTPRDFSAGPLTYTVVARDGSRRDYAVSVTVASESSKALEQFVLSGVTAFVVGSEVTLRLPAETDLRALVPDRLQHTGSSVTPPAAAAQDFREPVKYTVTAADGSSQTYTVRVTLQ